MSVPPASKPLATKPRAVVIGAGVAGLAAACLMAKDYDVTVLEKNPEPGGRVGRLRDGGFLWDTGPSWLLMPDAYKRFYQRMGTTMEAELDLVRLDPAYRVFHEGFDPVDVRSGIPEVRALFDALSPGDGEKVTAYLDSATDTYRMAVKMFLYTTFSSVRPFLTRAMLGRLGTLQRLLMTSLKRHVERNFSHPIAQKILQYPAVLLATSPADTPAMYHLLSHADLVEGVYYPRGGFGTVVDSLERLALGQGVELRFGYEARAITSTPVDAKETRHKATGVRVCQVNSDKGGVKETEVLPADVVIAAGDMYHTDTQLLPSKLRSHPERQARYWRGGGHVGRARPSPPTHPPPADPLQRMGGGFRCDLQFSARVVALHLRVQTLRDRRRDGPRRARKPVYFDPYQREHRHRTRQHVQRRANTQGGDACRRRDPTDQRPLRHPRPGRTRGRPAHAGTCGFCATLLRLARHCPRLCPHAAAVSLPAGQPGIQDGGGLVLRWEHHHPGCWGADVPDQRRECGLARRRLPGVITVGCPSR